MKQDKNDIKRHYYDILGRECYLGGLKFVKETSAWTEEGELEYIPFSVGPTKKNPRYPSGYAPKNRKPSFGVFFSMKERKWIVGTVLDEHITVEMILLRLKNICPPLVISPTQRCIFYVVGDEIIFSET